jgi:mannose-6-phosphate isomerase
MKELKEIFRTVPELKELVEHEDTDKLVTMEYDWGDEVKSNLQSAFTKLMTASKHMVFEAIGKLINRLNAESEVNILLSYNVCVCICIHIFYGSMHAQICIFPLGLYL